ncbi:hypothetical protein ACFL6I_14220 [candidate division KSB1 bacterium]
MKSLTRTLSITMFVPILIYVMTISIFAQEKQDVRKLLEGTWDLAVMIEGYEQYSTFVFSIKNDTLKGTWLSETGDIPLEGVEFKKGVFTGTLVVPEGMDYMAISITGTVTGDTMKGKGISDIMEYPFTGKRRKK